MTSYKQVISQSEFEKLKNTLSEEILKKVYFVVSDAEYENHIELEKNGCVPDFLKKKRKF